ncbi:MAG: 4Fe-4S dicluster domain-containing protein [Ignavibacteriales bacterium]|nr:4Fe-4S dicluster domain-containing protein [Ignavibacteriales bacterium]
MKIYKLKTSYKDFIKTLLQQGKEVVAPVNYQNTLLFRKITSVDEVVEPENYINTVRSAKEFVFPITEPIIEFSYKNKEIQLDDYTPEIKQKIIVGLRPCDAAAFPVIDNIFNFEYKDNFYNSRREDTTLVGVACENSDESCFCTSVGVSPDSLQGSDLFLKKNKSGNFFAYAHTEKGERLADQLKTVLEEVIELVDENPVYKQTAEKIRTPLEVDKIKDWLDKNFDNPAWDEYGARCLGCASCAYLCPTCHCFDIVDEMKYDHGLRRKNWDVCQFNSFTLHASGHNPRSDQSKRYRQRVMHKFKYYSDRFNKTLCTGCGRCIRACPVNLDIYEVVKSLPLNPLPKEGDF